MDVQYTGYFGSVSKSQVRREVVYDTVVNLKKKNYNETFSRPHKKNI